MRLSWDDWYMFMTFWISRRSPDPSTKHGAIFVNTKHRPLSFGYNGCPEGCDHSVLAVRPDKYYAVLHAELNAAINRDASLEGSTIYVTGMPCCRCWDLIIQVGAKRVVYGPTPCVACIDENDIRIRELLLKDHPEIVIDQWQGDLQLIRENLRAIFSILSGGTVDVSEICTNL